MAIHCAQRLLGSILYLFFLLFINFADETLHYITKEKQNVHNEILYMTMAE